MRQLRRGSSNKHAGRLAWRFFLTGLLQGIGMADSLGGVDGSLTGGSAKKTMIRSNGRRAAWLEPFALWWFPPTRKGNDK